MVLIAAIRVKMMNEMYRVTIPYAVYSEWQLYDDYMSTSVIGFSSYVMERYPEVLDAVYIFHTNGVTGATGAMVYQLDFESEDHYHWFLLKVV